jgi:hypothetical protein
MIFFFPHIRDASLPMGLGDAAADARTTEMRKKERKSAGSARN